MSNFLITLGLLVLAGVGVVTWQRRGGGKAERRRAKAIAEATTRRHEPLSPDDQQHAEAIHAIVEEYRTGELPKVRTAADRPLTVRDVARKYARRPKHGARRVPKSKRFDPLTSPIPLTEKPVMLPGRQPQPYDLGGFTEGWTRAEIDQMVAKAKAGRR